MEAVKEARGVGPANNSQEETRRRRRRNEERERERGRSQRKTRILKSFETQNEKHKNCGEMMLSTEFSSLETGVRPTVL